MVRSNGRKYNDERMVQLIAECELDDGRIARRLGVNASTVWRIRHGQSRPDLQARIDELINSYPRKIRRHAARHLKAVVDKHIEVALADNGETSQKCRDFLINFFFVDSRVGEEGRDDDAPMSGFLSGFDQLSPELQKRILEELGGPCDDTILENLMQKRAQTGRIR